MTVVNVRGTSGSGKTTIVRGIMAMGTVTPLDANKKPEGYRVDVPSLSKPVYVVGPYTTACGGCDAVPTQDEICRRIRAYAPLGHVLVEGLLMSHTFGRYAALDRELDAQGNHFIWAFLDTPLEVCLDRVRARREERRLSKKVVPEFKELDVTNTSDKWHSNRATFAKVVGGRESDWKTAPGHWTRAKLDGRWVPYQTATETVFSWLD